ncbi:hypothetical protein [Streptomyces sp. NPDC005125]
MKYFGVVYDVGLRFSGTDTLSVEPFNPVQVEHDMRAIADDLHANAVRIEGEDIERLMTASRAAHAAGLTVYFNPWKMDAGFDETRAYVAEAAGAAETLRREGADIVFVTGCEYTVFSDGIYPGSTVYERSAWVHEQLGDFGWPKSPIGLPEPFPEKAKELNRVLAALAETVRDVFGGPLTYSAAIFEDVDWSIFDIVGTNYYRETQTDEEYIAGLDYFGSHGKPIAIAEFGCCAYEGGAALGARGWRVLQGVNPDGTGNWRDGVVPTRSEREQAEYVERQLKVFATQDVVEAAFVYVFTHQGYPTGEGARDLDLGCYAIAKLFPDNDPRSKAMPPWEPKEAFHSAATFFQEHAAVGTPEG